MVTRFFRGRGLGVITQSYTPGAPTQDNPGDIAPDAPIILQIWYDASVNTYLQPTGRTNGQTITQWNDRSAFAHNLNPDGGSISLRPTYVTNQQNSLSALSFDGGDRLTANPFTDTVDNITGMTMFVVTKYDATTTQRMIETNATGDSELGFGISTDSTQKFSYYIANGYVTGDTADTAWNYHTIVVDGSQSVGNRLAVNVNGIASTLNEIQPVSNISLGSNTTLFVGSRPDTTLPYAGDIGEIIMYSRTLTEGEISSVENYLSGKWDL
jgi:hypothetical protein